MKVYTLSPVNFTYNDECYSEEGLTQPKMAFRKRENAEAKAAEMNAAHKKDNPLEDYDGVIENYYVVNEVDVPDSEAVDASTTEETAYARAIRMKNEARAAAKEAAQAAFKEGAKALFEKHPLLESFTFRAYTPYFNYGDTCTYGVYADEPDLNGESWEDSPLCSPGYKYELKNGKYQKVVTGEPGPLHEAWSTEIPRFVYRFDSEDIEAMFGDHVRVTVSYERATGRVDTTTDEYSHD